MSDFKLRIESTKGQIASETSLEIPIRGPERATHLVVLGGVAIPEYDVVPSTTIAGVAVGGKLERGQIIVTTGYRLHEKDEVLGIVDGNAALLQATTASLSSISMDDDSDILFAVDSVEARVAERWLQIHLDAAIFHGDATLSRISYQANFLIHRLTPRSQRARKRSRRGKRT